MATKLSLNVAGLEFDNPFFVASGPTTKSVRQLLRIEETGWAAASIKLSIDPAPYINRKPRYGLFKDCNALGFTAEKRLTADEGIRLIQEAKPRLKRLKLFANITYAGEDGADGWARLAYRFEEAGADAIELNMCCPNMSYNMETTSGNYHASDKKTGASMGQNAEIASDIVKAVRAAIHIPLFVKLTPEGGHIAQTAKTLFEAGADAVGGTGNRLGMSPIDTEHPGKGCYALQKEVSMACYSGAWLKPLAQRDVYEIRRACGMEYPVTAAGGITNGRDAIEMVLCGGTLLGVCAETLISGYDIVRPMLYELESYMDAHGYEDLAMMRGIIVPKMKTAPDLTLYKGYAAIKEPNLSAPCKSACPLHIPTQAFVQCIKKRDFAGAYRYFRENQPLRDLCALCPGGCEEACIRGRVDSPLEIKKLEQFILLWGKEHTEDLNKTEAKSNGFKATVIGAGPAGLACASFLNSAGFDVTLFDREDANAPLMLTGFGEARKNVLARLSAQGVHYAHESKKTEELKELFDAVFVATGAEKMLPLGILGEEYAVDAVSYLAAAPKKAGNGGRTVVVGNGFAALYASQRAANAGKNVTLLWTTKDQSSYAESCFEALKELGVHLLTDTVLKSIEQDTVCFMLNGIVLELPFDILVLEHRYFGAYEKEKPVLAGRNMPVKLSERVYAGGAAVHAGSISDAMAIGLNAAALIDMDLNGSNAVLKLQPKLHTVSAEKVLQRTGYLKKKMPEISKNKMLSEDEAVREAERCLNCGCGEGCQLCKTICCEFAPAVVVADTMKIQKELCAACGMCAQRCPNGNIEMVDLKELV